MSSGEHMPNEPNSPQMEGAGTADAPVNRQQQPSPVLYRITQIGESIPEGVDLRIEYPLILREQRPQTPVQRGPNSAR